MLIYMTQSAPKEKISFEECICDKNNTTFNLCFMHQKDVIAHSGTFYYEQLDKIYRHSRRRMVDL